VSAVPQVQQQGEPRAAVLVEMLVRHLSPLDYGTVVPYEQIRRVIFEDPQGLRGRGVTLRAGRRLLREYQRLLVNVRGQGYQIAQPGEHVAQSKRFQAFSRRRQRRALAILIHAEMSKLTPAERQQVDEETNRVRLKLALDRSLSKAKTLPRQKEAMPNLAKLLRAAKTE
jgi:hypothetical protein